MMGDLRLVDAGSRLHVASSERQKARPVRMGPTPLVRFKMQVFGCGPFSRFGVRRWRNTKSGAASPSVGRDDPLVGAYSIVSGGPTEPPQLPPCRPGGRRALWLPATSFGCSNRPVVRLETQRCLVVAVDHLLDVVVAVVVDVVPRLPPPATALVISATACPPTVRRAT